MIDPINALAVYITGTRVVRQSMALEMGGFAKAEADAFFALRAAFGVSGYATAEEAAASIRATLAAAGAPQ